MGYKTLPRRRVQIIRHIDWLKQINTKNPTCIYELICEWERILEETEEFIVS